MQPTIQEIEIFYKTATLPKCLYLYPFAWIGDVQKFVDNHIEKARINLRTQKNPYLIRLIDLKNILCKNMIENDLQLGISKQQLTKFQNARDSIANSEENTMGSIQKEVYLNSYKSMIDELQHNIKVYEEKQIAKQVQDTMVAFEMIQGLTVDKGTIECPACKNQLHFIKQPNKHIWAKCSTENCLQWVQ